MLFYSTMAAIIIYISGGARSGKSSYAQKLALEKSRNPVYVATAKNWGGDFDDRIKRHQKDRDKRWTNFEEQRKVSKLALDGRTVVIDCVTLWLTNFFMDTKQDIESTLQLFKEEVDALSKINAQLIFISNELGMGLHAETETGRKFTDLQGWANQYLASKSNQAFFMVSGLPLQLK